MTLGLRLLRGYVGNGITTAVTPFLVSHAVPGFWNEVSEPSAAYYNGVTYIAWCDDAQHLWACSWNHASRTASTPYDLGHVVDAVDGAIHLSPAVIVRNSDHRVMVFAVANGGSNIPGFWLSTNPQDATAFGSFNGFGDAQSYTYSHVVQLGSGDLYYFTYPIISGTRYLSFFTSSNGGSTWTSRTNLLSPGSTSSFYARVGTNGTLMDIFATDTNRLLATPSSVYHMRFDGSSLTKSDGTAISGSWPRPTTDGTLVQDSSLGSARPLGWGYQVSGNVAVAIGVNSGGTTTLLRRGTWSGSSWSVVAVADAGGIIDSNVFISGAAMSKGDPNTVWLSHKDGGTFEMHRYQTFDGGSTWVDTAVTSASSADNAMPDTPLDAAIGFQVLFGRGTYTSDSNFDFDVYGAGI